MTPARSLELLGLPPGVADRWAVQLAEPQRAYHTQAHIERMLADVPAEHSDDRELVAAIWLHDIVYDPRAGDNEERSAEQARHDLAGSGIDADAVAALILGTKRHEAGSLLGNVLNDLDLMVLGDAPAGYARYAGAIRREYAHVPEAAYRTGRAAVLRHFVARTRLYQDSRLREREAAARANLQRELDELERG